MTQFEEIFAGIVSNGVVLSKRAHTRLFVIGLMGVSMSNSGGSGSCRLLNNPNWGKLQGNKCSLIVFVFIIMWVFSDLA